ncbi:uncharacterized protein FIBRA_00005 [Fibroporia radiculosa]|uniref:Uncharacterized protein n=1 Tax=Fibroporia radiculosa TaxID=599839 RepID=J7RFY6_9APHY|nr:uncharacterized protein FIBRA_00005 [Fibroporia radiculosa]CCL98012.1 predicted protein [Fibroporia radiculosa]
MIRSSPEVAALEPDRTSYLLLTVCPCLLGSALPVRLYRMVHRPTDSRLLTNLLSHEKDYSKQLAHLLEHSQVSLGAFSAFAAASAPPLSQVIIAVGGVLASADDALRKYAASLEEWQNQLKALKDLEDEVGNIMRDREIFVTRLLKASKQQKPTRDSILSPSGSTSSLSFSKSEVTVGPKLSAAQTELQACEAHLAMKEHELDNMRIAAIRTGLQERCRAMVECGWTWGELGKNGLRALDTSQLLNGHVVGRLILSLVPTGAHSYPASPPFKPLPVPNSDSGHASSDISSLAPSQSASQIATIDQGSAHVDVSKWVYQPPDVYSPPRVLSPLSLPESVTPNGNLSTSWRISEVEEEDVEESSDDNEEDVAAMEVHENERFAPKSKGRGERRADANQDPQKSFSIRASTGTARHVQFPPPSPVTDSSSTQSKKKERHRSGSMTFFGRSIAALFHKEKGAQQVNDSPGGGPSGTRWQTRTDKHLTKHGDDSSDDEDGRIARARLAEQYSTWSYGPYNDIPQSQSVSFVGSPSASTASVPHRLKKRPAKRNLARGGSGARGEEDKGWVSDGVATSGAVARTGRPPLIKPEAGSSSTIKPALNGDAAAATSAQAVSRTPGGAKLSSPRGTASDVQASLSRNSSTSKQSIMNTPPPRAHTRSPVNPPTSPQSQQQTTPRRRTASLHLSPSPSDATPTSFTKGHRRVGSISSTHRSALTRDNDGPSLMSIVEGVAKQNREAGAKQDPNRLLMVPKAPPPVSVSIEHDVDRPPAASAAPGPSASASDRAVTSSTSRTRMSASSSAPTLPISAAGRPQAKMPLRSALRNSRTPSPNPPPPVVGLSVATSPAGPNVAVNGTKSDDDTASVSSYETVNEEFTEELEPIPPPPPPPNDKPRPMVGSDMSHSTSSTAPTTARRKSVRMSLPPTFSATPPAIDDDDDRGRLQPWVSRTPRSASSSRAGEWTSRVRPREGEARDVWQDSSDDDDEDYRRARRLLSRVAKAL